MLELGLCHRYAMLLRRSVESCSRTKYRVRWFWGRERAKAQVVQPLTRSSCPNFCGNPLRRLLPTFIFSGTCHSVTGQRLHTEWRGAGSLKDAEEKVVAGHRFHEKSIKFLAIFSVTERQVQHHVAVYDSRAKMPVREKHGLFYTGLLARHGGPHARTTV